ncbi:MAG: Gfo/Idh/MocA family oxidoreductase [Chloroflexi bacterium]|nr:Gfo/Idh/MocA family oxidoreductase [Chloroflexota bacterium]
MSDFFEKSDICEVSSAQQHLTNMVIRSHMGLQTSPLKFAIVGCGGIIAPTHVKALRQIPNAQIAAMCDINPETGKPRADEVGCPFFADHTELLEKIKPDVVTVCTPHPVHARIALDAFAAGAHVLTEKPMSVEVALADRMIAAADAAGKLLAVNFQQRFKPSIERAKALVDNGEIGDLVRVLVVEPWLRTYAYYRLSAWRGNWVGEGGAVLLNQSPHTLDLLCHLAGAPRKVWGWIRTLYHQIECEDTFQAMLEYPNGAPGYITSSTGEAGVQRRIQIVGDRGALELVGDTLSVYRFTPSTREFLRTSPEPFGQPDTQVEVVDLPGDAGGHLAVYQDLIAAIAEGRQPRASGREGLMSLELANAITLSSFAERAVTLPLDREEYTDLLNDLKAGRRKL